MKFTDRLSLGSVAKADLAHESTDLRNARKESESQGTTVRSRVLDRVERISGTYFELPREGSKAGLMVNTVKNLEHGLLWTFHNDVVSHGRLEDYAVVR